MTVRWRISHCTQSKWTCTQKALWNSSLALLLKPRALQCLGTITPLRSLASILNQWRWLESRGRDKCGCCQKCAFTRALLAAVMEVRSQTQCSKCHPQVWHSVLSLCIEVCSSKLRRGNCRKYLPVCPFSLERCTLYVQMASLSSYFLVENLLGEETPCHHHATSRHGAAACGTFDWPL